MEIKLYHGHTGPINSCQLIEDRDWLLTGSNDNTARLWNFHSGKQIHTYQLGHQMDAVPAARLNTQGTK